MRIPRPGPGNGWRHTIASGSPSSRPTRRTSSLNSVRSGSTSVELQVVGQAADVVVALDVGGAGAAAGLDDVGVEGALHEEVDGLAVGPGVGHHATGGLLEHPDELAPDRLALLLGIGDAGEGGEEALLGLDHVQRHAGGVHEVALDLLGLAGAEQAVVDEHAREAVADGPLHEGGGHRRVDPAGEPAQHPLVAHPARRRRRPARR